MGERVAAGRVRGVDFQFFHSFRQQGDVEVLDREVTWDKALFNQRGKPLVALSSKIVRGCNFSTGRFLS